MVRVNREMIYHPFKSVGKTHFIKYFHWKQKLITINLTRHQISHLLIITHLCDPHNSEMLSLSGSGGIVAQGVILTQ